MEPVGPGALPVPGAGPAPARPDVRRRSHPPPPALAGALLLGMLSLVVLSAFWPALPSWSAAPCAWAALLLLLPTLPPHQLRLSLCMLALGGSALLWAALRGQVPPPGRIFAINLELLALLSGVTFLRRITSPRGARDAGPPQGAVSFRRSLLGVHLFSVAINISALAIMGRQMQRDGGLSRLQLLMLSRCFSAAAFWSPFFAAMAVALSYAPGAELELLVLFGLPLACVSLVVTMLERAGDPGMRSFTGCSMRLSSLWLPLALGGMVLIAHRLLPAVSVLALITVAALLVTAAALLWQQGRRTGTILLRHVRCALPGSGAELSLFLSAGIFASGIGSLVESGLFALRIEHFGLVQAAGLLLLLILAALIGVHPVIGIATAAALLASLPIDPNLLGILFLASWALGVCLSPFSGMHLFLHSAFGARILVFPRWNWRYVFFMYWVVVAWVGLLWD